MGKALLINPSYFRTYASNEGGLVFPVYPILSLAALAGALVARRHRVTILDLSYRPYDPELIRQTILTEKPDVVGITATTPLVNQLRDIWYIVKSVSKDIACIGGGAHPSALPAETMAESALDGVAAGEHDWTLARLLDGSAPGEIDGLWWRGDDGESRSPRPARLLEDLDELPIPAWDLYPPACHQRVSRLIARHRPITTIEFSRGCVFHCDFCASKTTLGLGYRKKSPERCADEMARLAALGYREVIVVDDIFTSDVRWASAVCEAIIARGVSIAWTCTNGIRVDSCDEGLFRLMRRAGCYRVYFGFESGSDRVLRAFGKGGRATVSQGRAAVAAARAAGLEPNGFFQVGLSGDTEESMQDTIDYARQLPLDAMKCGITVAFPGTPMFNALRANQRLLTLDWDKYNVYQNVDAIYDHPTVSWPLVRAYLKRFYVEACFKNPAYLLRRFVYMFRNGELLWTVYYTIRFSLLLWGRRRTPQGESYQYRHLWEPRNIALGAINTYAVPVAVGAALQQRRRQQPPANDRSVPV